MINFEGWNKITKEKIEEFRIKVNEVIRGHLALNSSESMFKSFVLDSLSIGSSPPIFQLMDFSPSCPPLTVLDQNIPLRVSFPSSDSGTHGFFQRRHSDGMSNLDSVVSVYKQTTLDDGLCVKFRFGIDIEGENTFSTVLQLSFPIPGFAEIPLKFSVKNLKLNMVVVFNYSQKDDFFEVFFEKETFVMDYDFLVEIGSQKDHLVVDQEKVAGILSIKDLLEVDLKDHKETIEVLQNYIYAR